MSESPKITVPDFEEWEWGLRDDPPVKLEKLHKVLDSVAARGAEVFLQQISEELHMFFTGTHVRFSASDGNDFVIEYALPLEALLKDACEDWSATDSAQLVEGLRKLADEIEAQFVKAKTANQSTS